jgi:chromosome segregation ATPase
MSGWIGYALGYENGRSDAESSRQQRELVQRVMYGHRTVEVDQSYIDNLRQALHSASVTSDHNYDTADQFHREALEWKADALHYKASAAALQAQVTALEAQLAEQNTKLEQTQALYEWAHAKYDTAFHEKSDLDLFRLMSTWLLAAHAAGKADRPEFAQLRDMIQDISARLERGELFRGYRDEPEKQTHIIELANALRRD